MFSGKQKEETFNYVFYVKMEIFFNLVCIFVVVLNEKDILFENYSIIACGLTELNTWTFESAL